MQKKWLTLVGMFLFINVVSITAAFSQTSASNVNPPSTNTVQQDTQGDDLRTLQELAIEVKALRATNAGLTAERDALKNQVTVLTQINGLITEQKDFFKDAAVKGIKVDSNSGLAITTLEDAKKVCMAQNADLEKENSKLRSSRNTRAFIGFAAGAGLGYAAHK